MESTGGQKKTGHSDPSAQHILFVPQATVSHGIPLLKVATQLASHGIKVSFVAYEDQIPGLSIHLSSAEARTQYARNFQFLEVRRPQGPPPPNHDLDFQAELKPFVEKFAQDKRNDISGGPTCIIVDMFVPWAEEISELLKVPRYVLVTSGAPFGKYLLEYSCNYDRGIFEIGNGGILPYKGYVSDPGIPPLTHLDLPHRFRTMQNGAYFGLMASRALWTSNGILFNTFAELDQGVIEAWKLASENPRAEHTKVPPATYPVGPLLATTSASKYIPPDSGLDNSGESASQWLSSQPPSSVLYVAFGSRYHLSPEQVKGLALGLEASEQRFLWLLPKKAPTTDGEPVQDYLPEGFRERVGSRGCIVHGWVSQVQILGHSSTAGFLTHCGWNSVLESILNAVPLIAWPQIAEQRLNRRYLVDKLKIAIELKTTDENVASQDQVKDAIRRLLVELAGKKCKARMKEFQKLSQVAMSEGGSQSSNVEKLIHDICGGFAHH